jgi:polyisoprenoid-binding protein YceI
MSWKRWVLAGVAGVVLLVVLAPYVYIHFIEGTAPPALSLEADPTTAATQGSSVSGTWRVGSGSVVGYRISEVIFGQDNVAAGRTSSVRGSVAIDGSTVTSGSFTADLTTVSSDKERRDAQFQGRIMETATYPTATFKVTSPIELSSIPAVGVTGTARATGDLTLHGVTRSVTFTLTGKRSASGFQVTGSIPVTFADYNIENPSFGPVTTEDHGTLEFLLVFTR